MTHFDLVAAASGARFPRPSFQCLRHCVRRATVVPDDSDTRHRDGGGTARTCKRERHPDPIQPSVHG